MTLWPIWIMFMPLLAPMVQQHWLNFISLFFQKTLKLLTLFALTTSSARSSQGEITLFVKLNFLMLSLQCLSLILNYVLLFFYLFQFQTIDLVGLINVIDDFERFYHIWVYSAISKWWYTKCFNLSGYDKCLNLPVSAATICILLFILCEWIMSRLL